MNHWEKTITRRDEKHQMVGFGETYIRDLTVYGENDRVMEGRLVTFLYNLSSFISANLHCTFLWTIRSIFTCHNDVLFIRNCHIFRSIWLIDFIDILWWEFETCSLSDVIMHTFTKFQVTPHAFSIGGALKGREPLSVSLIITCNRLFSVRH